MTVVLDTRVCTDHFPGIGRYASALAHALMEVSPDLDLTLLEYDGPGRKGVEALGAKRILSRSSPFSLRQQWEVPSLLSRSRAALYHSPYYMMPYAARVPTAVTIHDFIPYRFPEYYSRSRVVAIRAATWLAVRRADAFLAVSQATKDDLCRFLDVPAERVHVTPPGADPIFRPGSGGEIREWRARFDLPERYVLYVGTNKPHKNLVRLIEAYAIAVQETALRDSMLLLAGSWDPRYPDARSRVENLGLGTRVRFVRGASDEMLRACYAAATVFVLPSVYEGFGSPLVEAMASGAPAVCGPALSETAGDAALMVNVQDPEEMAHAMGSVADSPTLSRSLRERGLARAREFTYARTARATLDVYRDLIGKEALVRSASHDVGRAGAARGEERVLS